MCQKNYSRSPSDPPSASCTRPPSAPRNLIYSLKQSTLVLEWSAPADLGGRTDVTYNLLCDRCSAALRRQCEQCGSSVGFVPQQTGLVDRTVTLVNLLPHVNYTIRVAAVNGVSDFNASSKPQYAEVNISTSLRAPALIADIRTDKIEQKSISLSWQEPGFPSASNTGYEIKYFEKPRLARLPGGRGGFRARARRPGPGRRQRQPEPRGVGGTMETGGGGFLVRLLLLLPLPGAAAEEGHDAPYAWKDPRSLYALHH
ncbi:ephrin type-A receptor 7-like [Gopherus flavomarginatus]|uniref:ephrin type-A receptor 7-like n=1 Tax=Gopherus flavomarginatus TaxID=286002 RepID=UPI0021CBACCE|nr:ephrin type-A receptor 7-like [Gopherus flavomarginatus]